MVRNLLLPLQVTIKDGVLLLLHSKHEEDLLVHLVDWLHLCLQLQAYVILQGILRVALICVRTIVMISTTTQECQQGSLLSQQGAQQQPPRDPVIMLLWNVSVIATNP